MHLGNSDDAKARVGHLAGYRRTESGWTLGRWASFATSTVPTTSGRVWGSPETDRAVGAGVVYGPGP